MPTYANVRNGWFGSATSRNNGALECRGSNQNLAKMRFQKYGLVLKAFNVIETPIED